MLKMIQCDKFIDKGQIRPPITFKRGLNTILGDEIGSNSIGKTTFLMILDFVFGGDDYVRKSTDVQANIGPHTIKFTFEFEDGLHYFSRATDDPTTINVCDAQYQIVAAFSKDEYTQFLSKKFKLDLPDLTLRNAVSRFFRVHGRETLDPKQPLQNAAKEPQHIGIDALLKLFDRYSAVKIQKAKAAEAELKEKMFKGAQKYNYLPSASNKTQYSENKKRILALEEEINCLVRDSTQGFIEIETLQTEDLSVLQQQLKIEKRYYISLTTELNSMETRTSKQRASEKDYDKLQQFFPEVHLKRLEEIDHFHKKMSHILKSEFKEKAVNLQNMINLSAERISQLEMKIVEIGNIPNVTHAILNKHSQKQRERDQLQAANDSYDTKEALKQNTKELKALLNALILEVITHTETDINAMMDQLNKWINNIKTAPYLTIKDAGRYTFFTPNDHGTGSQYKGLILFDLTALTLTPLPLLVHDSVLLKQIEDRALEEILKLYIQSQKQVFIVLDKKSSFPKKTQHILQETKVLQLSPNGGELFGKAWNHTN